MTDAFAAVTDNAGQRTDASIHARVVALRGHINADGMSTAGEFAIALPLNEAL